MTNALTEMSRTRIEHGDKPDDQRAATGFQSGPNPLTTKLR
jgi:hypothetical protein